MTYRALITLLLLVMSGGLLTAQDTPTPMPDDGEIELGVFEMSFAEDERLYGVVPSAWDEIQAGTAIRIEEDGQNLTYLLHLAIPETRIEGAIVPLLEPLELDELPDPSSEYDEGYFIWTLYDVQYEPEQLEGESLSVIIATAEDDAGAYVMVLQSRPDEIDDLYEDVMIPALDTFGLPRDEITDYLELEAFTNVEIPDFEVSAIVPSAWKNVNPGAFMRGTSETDFTTLLIQTSADLGQRDFADLLRESIGVAIELPDDSELYALDNFDWSVYELDFEAQGTEVTLIIATANDETLTYMVALLSLSDEAAALLDDVLIPIMESITPV